MSDNSHEPELSPTIILPPGAEFEIETASRPSLMQRLFSSLGAAVKAVVAAPVRLLAWTGERLNDALRVTFGYTGEITGDIGFLAKKAGGVLLGIVNVAVLGLVALAFSPTPGHALVSLAILGLIFLSLRGKIELVDAFMLCIVVPVGVAVVGMLATGLLLTAFTLTAVGLPVLVMIAGGVSLALAAQHFIESNRRVQSVPATTEATGVA